MLGTDGGRAPKKKAGKKKSCSGCNEVVLLTEKERIKSSDRQEKRKHPLLPTKTQTSTDGVSRREEVWSGKRAKANASIDYKNSETRRGLVMTPPPGAQNDSQ